MSTQTNYARSLGASSIALWTMDGLENGREADRLDACDSTSYYQSFDKYYHGGLPFTHIQCWDYGQLSFETCVDGAQTGSGPDCDEDVHGYDWGIRTIVNDLPATWAWWSGV